DQAPSGPDGGQSLLVPQQRPFATPADGGCGCGSTTLTPEDPNASGGNPAAHGVSGGAVRYADGATVVCATDFSSGGFGASFGESRTWTNQAFAANLEFDSPQAAGLGSGWVLTDQPWLIQDGTTVEVVSGPRQIYFFDSDGAGGYTPRFFL